MFKKIDDGLNWLYQRKRFDRRENLSLIEEALRRLNNPESSFKSIHIAGTNGKGSCASYIYNILKLSGIKTAIFTSPHVLKFNERIEVNGKYIPDNELLKYINFIYEFNEEFMRTHETLTFFELTTIIAFLYFKDQGVEIAVVECGLGGRLDATNILKPLVSIITSISKDHTDVLGKTYRSILHEKLGIVKDNTPLIAYINHKDLKKDYLECTTSHNSKLIEVKNVRNIKYDKTHMSFSYKGKKYESGIIGNIQPVIASIAIETINALVNYKYNINSYLIYEGLKNTKIPCRMEYLKDYNILIDGAHNFDAIKETINNTKKYFSDNFLVVYGCMKDKDYNSIIKLLNKETDTIFFTKINYPRFKEEKELYDLSTVKNKYYFDDLKDTLDYIFKNRTKNSLILITGSFYLTSEAKMLLEMKTC